MTLTLHWWMLPLFIALLAIAWFAWRIRLPRGDWDFFSGAFDAAIAVCALLVAAAIVLGHFL